MCNICKAVGTADAICAMHVQDNRTLDHGEMQEALVKMGLFTTQENFDILFRQLDKDMSGTLHFEAS